MNTPLVLVSHVLCPYVQRAAIVMAEKGLAFERRDVDLAEKPEWFRRISPLGKTPVLLVGEEAVFESAVICEYLDETALPRLHPPNALQRAQHRSWMEFGSALLNAIGAFYNAPDERVLRERAAEIHARLGHLEGVLGAGPYFSGEHFSLVDAVFGPVFRYFDVFDAIGEFGFWNGLQNVPRWRRALATRPSVRAAVQPDYAERLQRFLLARSGALSQRLAVAISAEPTPAHRTAAASPRPPRAR